MDVAEGPARNRGAAANGPYLRQVGGGVDTFDQADPLAVAQLSAPPAAC
jgi:hypothetical protein